MPIIKYVKDKHTGAITDAYPPTFKMKVPFGRDKYTCDLGNYEKIPGDSILLTSRSVLGRANITMWLA